MERHFVGDAIEIENNREMKKSFKTNIRLDEAYINKLKRQKLSDGMKAIFLPEEEEYR